MNQFVRYLTIIAISSGAQAADDILRFQNGDQLHGTFHGISDDGSICFQNSEMKSVADFGVKSLRQLVLRGGQPGRPADTLTHAGLINDDSIPGRIVAFDDKNLTLESDALGTLQIPRGHLTMLAVNPMGGKIHYYGPFSDQQWTTLTSTAKKKEIEAEEADEKDAVDKKEEEKAAAKEEDKPRLGWEFAGSAWYWKGEGKSDIRNGNHSAGALVMNDVMSDCSVVRFRIDWRDRLGVSFVFHADMNTGNPDDDDEDQKSAREQGVISSLVGNAYVVQMYSSHVMLYRSAWGKEEGSQFERVQKTTSLRLWSDRTAVVEVRSNRRNGRISLFMNGEFLTQWSEPAAFAKEGEPSFAGKGGGIGFAPLPGMGAIRVSEILVSEWNGLPDSARSMKLEEKDVVLMTNGTDRFSGKAMRLDDEDKLHFEGAHGTMFLPLEEVAEIRFASSGFSKSGEEEDEEEKTQSAVMHLSPVGKITAHSMKGERSAIKMQHPLLGAVDMQTEPLIMMEYQPEERLSDFWNEDL